MASKIKHDANGKFVAYYRVSTKKQGASGLGLEAQSAAVRNYLNLHKDSTWRLIAEFTEVETGKNDDRKELEKAFAMAKVHRASLIIAKLDRLARSVRKVSNLMDDGVRIIAVDSPTATEFGINIKAAMDQEEAERASIRTREALAALKARGVKLGGDHGISKFAKQGSIAGAKARSANADEFAHSMRFIVDAIRKEGVSGAAAIARKLNEQEHPARRGGQWSVMQVERLLQRLQKMNSNAA
jgi:DNA invertase Pin-like site-specific DNA recombinase